MTDYLLMMLFIGLMFWPWLLAGAAIGAAVVVGIVLAVSRMRQTRPKVLNESPNHFAGKEYRFLRAHETLKAGDQLEFIGSGWCDISLDWIGEEVFRPNSYRRRIDTQQPAEQTPADAPEGFE